MNDFDELRQKLDLLNDEHLLTILREHDDEQWRPEVFDIVASLLRERGVSPDTESENEEDVLAESADADLVTLASYFKSIDAETDRLALEAKGLRAWIFNEHVPGMVGPIGEVQLRVLKEDFAAAMAILNSEPVSSSDLPDEIAEPPCPKCGSRKVTEEAEIVESLDESQGTSRSYHPAPRQMWFYKCGACGHKWPDS